MEGSLSFFSLFSSLSLPLRLRLLSRRNMSCPHLRLLLMLSFCYILFSLKYKVLLPCSQNDSLLSVLRTRFISFLLGFHFCLYFTLPGIFSPQSLKSYLRLWHNQTIIPHLTSPESQTNKRPNTKCKIVLQSECQYHDHYYYQAQCKYKQEADFWLVSSGQHCPLIGHLIRFTKGGVRGNSQSNIWSEKSV